MEKLRNVLITDRTQADANAQNDKGTYNYTDLNRVLRACAWLAERLERYGYKVPFDYHKAYLMAVQARPEGGGTVCGALGYSGETITVKAEPAEEFEFNGWMEAGQIVSRSLEYSFTADRDRDLAAVFEAMSGFTGFIPAGEAEPLLAADGQEFIVMR